MTSINQYTFYVDFVAASFLALNSIQSIFSLHTAPFPRSECNVFHLLYTISSTTYIHTNVLRANVYFVQWIFVDLWAQRNKPKSKKHKNESISIEHEMEWHRIYVSKKKTLCGIIEFAKFQYTVSNEFRWQKSHIYNLNVYFSIGYFRSIQFRSSIEVFQFIQAIFRVYTFSHILCSNGFYAN